MLGTVLTWRPEADWSRAFKVDYEDARRGAFWLALTLKTDSIAFAGTIHRGNDQLTPAFWFGNTAYWNHCSEKAVSHGNTLKFEHNSANPLEQNSGATFCIFAESFRNFLCNPLRLNCQELSSIKHNDILPLLAPFSLSASARCASARQPSPSGSARRAEAQLR